MSERVVVVEGFLDRAFVSGFLKSLGCTSLGKKGCPPPKDPWGAAVRGGQYAFQSAAGAFIRVVPVEGNALDLRVRTLVEGARTEPIEHLIVVPDADLMAGADPVPRLRSKRDNLVGLLKGKPTGDFGFVAAGVGLGEVAVWAANDAEPRLPQKQALERLVVAAIADAYPAWFKHASVFLDQRPEPPQVTGREEAMALMAGWFSHRFSEGFFEAVWEDTGIAKGLVARLQAFPTLDQFRRLAV